MFDSFILSFFSLFFLSLIPRPSLGFFLLCSCFPFVSVLVDALERSKMTNKAKPVTKDPKKVPANIRSAVHSIGRTLESNFRGVSDFGGSD